jgi:gliding motility-associated-like protein
MGQVRLIKIRVIAIVLLCLVYTRASAILKADFTVSGAIGCSPVVAAFTNTSTGAVSYFWDFGNGNTSTNLNPGAIYTTAGSYTVKLVAIDGSGNTDTMKKTNVITVYQNPVAGFKTNAVSACLPAVINFTDTTNSGSGAITSWKWDFGDGSVSSSQNPSHTYNNAGTYTISLVVSNTLGCKSTLIRSNFITAVQKPSISFYGNQTQFCDSTGTVNFTDNSSNEIAGKTTWLWRFGDGTTSTLQNPSHTYTKFGSYKVTLVVNVAGGCIDSLVFNSYINLLKYTYNFKADKTSGCGLFNINFTNLTTPNFGWINYTWDFGDGTTSNLLNPSHIYLDSGTYTVKLIASGSLNGCVDTVIKKNYISVGVRPTAKFSSSDSTACKTPKKITFTNLSTNGAATWQWDFGDGGTSTAKNPVHTYTADGVYTVRLIAKTIEGCTDTLTVTDMIQIIAPKAAIQSPRPFGCKSDNSIQFADQTSSIVPITSRTWYFGDGDTSHSQNPIHTYADTGKYTVILVVSTKDSCKDSLRSMNFVKIGLKPTASFIGSPQDSCIQYMTVQFKEFSDTFKVKPDQYNWDFGDGATSAASNPSHFYNDKPRPYTVKLVVFSNGCSDTLTRTNYIRVHGPKADFMFFIQPCSPDSVYFTNTTLGGNKYTWDFGDSTTSNLKDPAHKFSAPGNYKVILHAFDTAMGCFNDTNRIITIPDFSRYKAGFLSDITSGCYPITVNFTDTSFNAQSRQWDFGNGQTSTQASAVAVYSEPGLYTVKLSIVTDKGCTETATRTNFIKAFGAVPSFDICKAEECGAGPVKFTDFTRSPDPVSKRVWSFGDGNTLTTTDSSVTYNYTSILPNQLVGYTVRLTVTDSAGCSAFKEDRIRQTKPYQIISKSFTTLCGAVQYYFNPINTISTGVTPYIYSWTWETEAPVFQNSYSRYIIDTGWFHIKLVYIDYYGCKDSVKDSVHVKISKPKAGFLQSDTFSSCPPLQVQFTDTSTLGSTNVKSWAWDFGDNTQSTFQNPKKLFVLPGKYTVKLTITDIAGCTSTMIKTALIHIKGPTGSYSFSPTKGCDSAVITFKASSSNASKLEWDLGDGTIVQDSDFVHTFHQKNLTSNGIYMPKLILSDTLGCTYAAPSFDTVRVWGKEIIKPAANDSVICDTGIVAFADSTFHINKPVSWLWTFGDGSTDTARNPFHRYTSYDTFTVKLIVTDSTGCVDSATRYKWIAVSKQMHPAFGMSNFGQCQQQSVSFYDSSTSTKFPVTGYLWNFGDGDTSSQKNPTHTYLTGGVFKVKLTIINKHGCKDSVSKNITIKTRPVAKLYPSDNCFLDSTSFIDSSISTAGTITSRTIYFGDGDSSVSFGAKHVYKKFGRYQAKLVVVSSYGCIDSAKHVLHIFQQPRSGFSVNAVCMYDSAHFQDTSKIDSGSITSWKWDFGDLATSTLQNPYHHYTGAGGYIVSLVTTSDKGCSDTSSNSVTIFPKPVASFSKVDKCQADSIRFIDKSTIASGAINSWKWDFNDPGSGAANTTSLLQNPVHLFSAPGYFNVKLVVQSALGCLDSVSDVSTVLPMPAAGFMKSDACFEDAVSFRDISQIATGNITGWRWNFGDTGSGTNDTTSVQNPKHRYSNSGAFKIKLIAISQFGCKDSITDSLTIFPKPKAKFGASAACFTDTTIFKDSSSISSGNIISWSWDFGDGNTSSIENPIHYYSSSGTYDVKLIIISDKGCSDTVIRKVTVFPRPKSAFSFSSSCRRDSVLFTNNSTISGGSLSSYHWDFGDGKTSTLKDPYHLYSVEGTYKLTLIIFSDKGCSDTAHDSITIYPMPKASFSSANICPYDSMIFANNSSISSGTMTYEWDFGDGDSSLSASPKHKYATDGKYRVRLIAISGKGCRDTITDSFTVYPKPKAAFSYVNICRIDSMHFADGSTVKSGTIISWDWDFGDGKNSAAQNPAHLYAAAGNYNVRLAISTANGCVDTLINLVTVHPMPAAGFTKSDICFGNAVPFRDTSTIATGNITGWQWNFGDTGSGAANISSLQNPNHMFSRFGTFGIKLKVTSQFGCKDSVTDSVVIFPKPKAKFGASTACFSDTTIFKDSSIIGSGNINSWSWDFGDGSTSNIENPVHLYGSSGTYNVQLIIFSDKGCGDTILKKVNVFPRPKADFSFANSCRRDSVLFTNKSLISTGAIGSYHWDFGDGTTSAKKDPYHLYSIEGIYKVTLITYSDKACSDTFSNSITIYPMPKAAFSSGNTCPYDSMIFANSSSISSGTMTYAWDFGDGNSSSLTSPKHKYATDGKYIVRLIAISDKGCRDTVKDSFTVYPRPKAGFSVSNACKYDSVRFTDNSTVKSGIVNSWKWDFGDGSVSTLKNPSHLYSIASSYSVRLIVSTNNGCVDTIIKTITIYPMPAASFSAPNFCFGNQAVFTDNSTVSSGNISGWLWNFGDGNTATGQTQNHSYKAAGSYSVKLVITTALGCKDSITKPLIVNPKPKSKYAVTTVCYRNTTQFMDSSNISKGSIISWNWNFGDGNNSSIQNPGHVYLAGTYGTSLIVHSDSGCADTSALNVTVYPKPKSLFTVSDICQVDSAVFTSMASVSSGNLVKYAWDFGDAATSGIPNPKHKYLNPGTYNVKFYVTTDKACKDTSSQILVIHPMPIAKFGSLSQCQAQPVIFKDSSSVVTGRINVWKWYFGDGQSSTDSLPVHYYAKNDSYTVKLVVSTAFGCGDSTSRRQVIWPLPKADFKVLNSCVYDSLNFADNSLISSGKVSGWNWDFNDGSSSALQNPKHLYLADGTYRVRLVAFSNNGCNDTVYHNVIVFPKPNVKWGADPVCFKLDSKFLDSTTINSGSIVSQKWSFGDGAGSTLQNPVHHYLRPDTFTVKLIKYSDLGCRDSLSKPVIVHPLPVSKWTSSAACERDSNYFTDKSIIRSGAVTAWQWQFGDGNTSTRQNPGHVYPGPGTYKALLIAISSYGCPDTSKTQDVTVYPRSKPSFAVQPVCYGDTSRFRNSTSIIIGGKVVKYRWNFGDSVTNILASPNHLYRYPKSFKVQLVTTTDKGCSDSITQNAVVYHWPAPDFDPATLCFGDTIHFVNKSTSIDGNIIRQHWEFGDGDTSGVFAPAHFYKKKGYYNVKLTVFTDVGCTNSITKRIHILRLIPQFYGSDTLTCLNTPILFKDYSFSDTGIVKWFWDFGDGGSSTLQNPYYAYKNSGHFDVKLSVADITGCVRTIIKKNYIEILDTIPPDKVPILRATVVDDATVNIDFPKYTKYDFGSYVLSRDMGGGNFMQVFTSADANDTSFNDIGLNTLKKTYSYKLQIKDRCGYLWPLDSSRTHTTMNVTGKTAINKALLDWTPYVGWDTVLRYVIYRQNVFRPLEWDSIGWVYGDSLHYTDYEIICYRTHHYKIKAVEERGHEQFAWSDTTAVTPIYIPNVIRNDIIRATVEQDRSVLVEWSPSRTKRPWNYILQRSINNINFKTIGVYDRRTFHAYDQNVRVNDSSYIYRMFVKDSCGDLSGFTNIAKTILLKIDTVQTSGHPALYWTQYKDWPLGVDHYEIQWLENATGTWKTVGTVPAVDTQFVDMISHAKQTLYCYRVIGYSRENDSVFSVSNEACVPTIMHLYVPNAFTPNTDSINQSFNAKGVFIFDYTMKLYNRWGELIFQTNDLHRGWDGTFRGDPAPEGVYIYWIYAAGSNSQVYSRSGNVTLLR